MDILKQNDTATALVFPLISSADHISPAISVTPTVLLSKNGGAFTAPGGAVTEIGNGWYKLSPVSADTSTLGYLVLHATAGGADPTDVTYRVVAFDPGDTVRMGLTALPGAAIELASGTAQGGSSSTIQLAGSDSGTAGQYQGALLVITGGTGAGQRRVIAQYNSTSKVATLASGRTFTPAPDATSTYRVVGGDFAAVSDALQVSVSGNVLTAGAASAAGANTITLATTAGSTGELYTGCVIAITSGTGAGQSRVITDYNGSTRVATVDQPWAASLDTSSQYAVVPSRAPKLTSKLEVDLDMVQAVPIASTSPATLASALANAEAIGLGNIEINTSTNIMTILASDNSTVLATFLLTPSASNQLNRVRQTP